MSSIKLQEGGFAPDLNVKDVMGQTIHLRNYRGKRVLLSFFRYVTCPLCNLRIAHFMKEYPKLEDDIEVIAVFESSDDYIRQYVGPKGLPFPIIADPDGVLFKEFGVEKSWLKSFLGMFRIPTMLQAMRLNRFRTGMGDGPPNRVPADFLIDGNGLLSVCHYGSDITDHIPLQTIEEFIHPEMHHVGQTT